MKKITIFAAALALSACNKVAETPTEPAASNDMAGMEMSAAVKTASSTGKITEIDKAGGKVTIAHGPIPAVGWPAMTMGFKAAPKLLEGVGTGDQVDFTISLKGNDGTVTALTRK
jgi:Cu/Ag efflux protein CusF